MAAQQKTASRKDEVDFHGGTVIGKDGNEVAITEDMVRQAIRELDPDAFVDAETNDSDSP
jgi:preprotein translocase subunit SecF